jgi:TonB family protein
LYLIPSARNLSKRRLFVPTIRAFSLCIALYLTAASSVGTQIQPRPTRPPEVAVPNKNRPIGLASIARELAAELSGIGCRKVVVMDFWGSDASWSPFSSWLADQFSTAIRSSGYPIEVADRAQLLIRLEANGLSQEIGSRVEILRVANSLGADTLVQGTYGSAEHGIGITLHAYYVTDPRHANPDDAYARDAEVRGKIPMREIAIVVPLPPDASKKYLFSGEGGISSPECVYCPNPQFSAEAKKIKLQGTVLLDAIITAEGSATQITVVKGLGHGLDEHAIECVKEWRLRPAIEADGNPVSIPAPLEVVFRLNP